MSLRVEPLQISIVLSAVMICSAIFWQWSYQVAVIFLFLLFNVHLNNEFKILLNSEMLRFGDEVL